MADVTDRHRERAQAIVDAWKDQWSLEPREDLNKAWRGRVDESLVSRIAQEIAVLAPWQPIETAPKQRKIIVGYLNPLGKWRTVLARYYLENELEWHDQSPYYGEGFAPEGWYELCETHEDILPTDHEPTHWMPLPAPPPQRVTEQEARVQCLAVDHWASLPDPREK